ncbi:DUF6314 family protein [Pacificispira sp.]|uniref:DUF6314 family protein n=1 Tax=Pacificispira sp. TaxID=2888761 RepID=UPI003B5266D1
MTPIAHNFDLGGRWRLSRLVFDFSEGTFLRGTGEMQAVADGARLWRLQETLIFNGFEAQRDSLWQIVGQSLHLRYADGAPLVVLDLTQGTAEDAHLCAPDRYLARFKTLGSDRFKLSWRVTGPRKNYAMVTDYRRLG